MRRGTTRCVKLLIAAAVPHEKTNEILFLNGYVAVVVESALINPPSWIFCCTADWPLKRDITSRRCTAGYILAFSANAVYNTTCITPIQ